MLFRSVVHTSAARARQSQQVPQPAQAIVPEVPVQADSPVVQTPDPVVEQPVAPATDPVAKVAEAPKTVEQATQGQGLAGAIARTRQIKQELDRTRRQQAQDTGVKKI